MEYNNNIITLVRGDTLKCPIYINIGTNIDPIYYVLQENDKLYFGLMECNQKFENAILKKTMTSETEKTEVGLPILTINPADTEYLHPGRYYYSVKLLKANGEVKTVTPNTLFYIID